MRGHLAFTFRCHHHRVTRGPDPELAAFVTRTLRRPAREVRRLRFVSAASLTPDLVHDTRIAIRRLRSDLRTLAPLLDADAVHDLRERLGDLDLVIVPVRDADVIAARLEATAAQVTDALDPECMHAIAQRFAAAQEHSRSALLAELASGRFTKLLRDLGRIDGDVLAVSHQGLQKALEVRNARTWRRLQEAVMAAGDDPSDAELHRIRVLLKRSRYLAEASAPVLGRRMAKQAKRLARAQQVLGEHQDSVILSATLVLMPALTPEHRRTIDALLAVETDARRRLRRKWRKRWAKVRP